MGILTSIAEKIRLRLLTRNEYESLPLRQWFAQRWGVEVGLYSYGCFDPWRIPARTRIGRYCSFAKSARILDANHPLDALTTHPYLYERRFGVVDKDLIDPAWITIEDGVWISHNATISPGCKHIGRGAVIGAGAVVTKDVPAYAIVVGAPGKVLRYRFDPEMQAAIEASRWWEMDKSELRTLAGEKYADLIHPTVESMKRLRLAAT
jgi:virginiamycin A acetyltransferase